MTNSRAIAADGILAVWNDCAPDLREDYEAWYLAEHLIERLSVPGFHWGRRYRALDGGPEYFTYYQTDSAAVLVSDAYRARLDAPTPETRRIMTTAFWNMSRTVCRRTASGGCIRGAAVVTVTGWPGTRFAADVVEGCPPTLWRESWEGADDVDAVSEEERLRGGDTRIGACLLIDCTDDDMARAVAERQRLRFPTARVHAYTLIHTLDRDAL